MALTPSNSNLPAVLEGEISVLAALQSRSRKIQRVIISNDIAGDEVRDLEQAARIAAIRIERLTRAQIDVIAQGKTHGGVVAEVGERRFLSLDVLLTWKPTDVLTPNARALTHPPSPPRATKCSSASVSRSASVSASSPPGTTRTPSPRSANSAPRERTRDAISSISTL